MANGDYGRRGRQTSRVAGSVFSFPSLPHGANVFTTAAYFVALNTVSAVYQRINAVTDQSLPQDGNNNFLLPDDYVVMAAYALGGNATAARINTPSLRAFVLPEIYPITVAAVPDNTDTPITYQGRGPRVLRNEGLELDMSFNAVAAAPAWGALWLGKGIQAAPQGPVFTALASATITAVQGAWVLGQMTLNQNLPVGTYAVVGMGIVAANTVLGRLVFTGQNNFRPGVLVQKTYGQKPLDDYFRNGRMGLFGTFTNTTLPQLELFGDAAGAAAPVVYLDLVKIG